MLMWCDYPRVYLCLSFLHFYIDLSLPLLPWPCRPPPLIFLRLEKYERGRLNNQKSATPFLWRARLGFWKMTAAKCLKWPITASYQMAVWWQYMGNWSSWTHTRTLHSGPALPLAETGVNSQGGVDETWAWQERTLKATPSEEHNKATCRLFMVTDGRVDKVLREKGEGHLIFLWSREQFYNCLCVTS